MTTIKELLNNESFMKMAITVLFWAVLYGLVKLFTIRAGADDLLRMGEKKVIKLKKLTRQFRILCTARGAHKNVAKAVKLLRKIIKMEKKATRLLVMYLFDDRGDLDVAGAKDLVAKIPMNPKLAAACDTGMLELFEGDWLDSLAEKIEQMDKQ